MAVAAAPPVATLPFCLFSANAAVGGNAKRGGRRAMFVWLQQVRQALIGSALQRTAELTCTHTAAAVVAGATVKCRDPGRCCLPQGAQKNATLGAGGGGAGGGVPSTGGWGRGRLRRLVLVLMMKRGQPNPLPGVPPPAAR